MSQNTEARKHGLQPPLPLVDADVGTGEPPPPDSDAEWRLDEHTRDVGRRGIAAARARLRSSSATARRTGPDRGPGPGAPEHAPGRAA